MKRDIQAFRRLAPTAQIAALRGERAERTFQFDRAVGEIDEKARTVWLSIASERSGVVRWWGEEILSITPQAIRDERLRAGAALLVGHNPDDQVGVIERYEIVNKKLRVLARFGKSARAEEIWRDVLDGIRRNASIGYQILDLHLEKEGKDFNTYRVTDWEPLEGSLVAIPADPSVGVGRSYTKGKQMHEDDEVQTRSDNRRDSEADRVKALLAAGREFKDQGGLELAMRLIDDPSANMETFKGRMLESMRGAQKPFATAQLFDFEPTFGAGARAILRQPKHFTGPDAQERAFRSGQWLRAQLYGNDSAKRWCGEHGLEVRAMSADVASKGGYLVPEELSSAIIDLSEKYGVFRGSTEVWPMASDTLLVPKSTSDPTGGFISENASLPESDGAWGSVQLVAKKYGAILRMSTELAEDSSIDVADWVAMQFGRQFAKIEDQCGFMGDGTSTYGGMQGIFTQIVDGTHNAGKVTAATNHDTFAEIDKTDLEDLMAALPEYAHERAKFYCSHVAWVKVFLRLMTATNGNSVSDVAANVPRFYQGYPVVTSTVLPAGASTDYSSQTMIAFGDINRSSKFGSRREIRIKLLTETYAASDQLGVQATERFHIVNHGLGDNTTAGPMVGLVGAA